MSTNRTTASEPGESVEATLCTNNCGFFSNPGCMGMCSMCYRDYDSRQKKQDKEKSTGPGADGVIMARNNRDELMDDAEPSPPAPDVPELGAVVPLTGKKHSVAVSSDDLVEHTFDGQMTGLSDPSGTATASCEGNTPPRKKRCTAADCKKRVGMMGFKCRCGGIFCEGHRYPEAHSCEFDHKASERRKIAVENPVVRGNKLEKI